MLLLQNEINKIDYIIEKAYKKGMCIIFNPSPYNDEIKNIDFNMLSYIIINEVEMSELTRGDNPKDGLKYFAKNYPKLKIIITLGSEGSMYGDTEKVVFQRHLRLMPLIQLPREIHLQDTFLHKQQWGTLLKTH